MGERPPVACRVCGTATSDGTVCSTCKPKATTDQQPKESKFSGKKEWSHLYNLARWCGKNGLRAATLRRYPICRKCGRLPSTHADHVIPHRGNLTLFFDFKNLQGLCESCHSAKTADEIRDRAKPPVNCLVNGLVAGQG